MEPILAPKPRVTTLLDNTVLDRMGRMRLHTARRFTNRMRGEHLSGKGGSSTEFSDYRDYSAGDDTRYIDWNIFARLLRPYMKLYHLEEEMHVLLLVDGSSSMQFDGKFDLARKLAAALGVLGLLGVERVSAYVFNQMGKDPTFLPASTGRGNMRKLFAFLENVQGGGDAPLEHGIEQVLKRHRGRGAAIVLSDFLTFGDLPRGFNLLFSAGLEPMAIQVLAPAEIDPEVNGDLRLVDSETQQTLDISAGGDLLSIYRDYVMAHQARVDQLCKQRSGRSVSISSHDAVDWVLFDLLPQEGVGAMSFLPGFFSLSSAWLFALLLPVIVFYFLKLRRPKMQVPSLVLWQQAISDSRVNSPFQRFKRNLLLLVQLLLLCLLALAAMQPYWKGSADRAARLPILIDCSASMAALDKPGGVSRLEAAKEKVRTIIDGLLSDQEICLISFSRSASKLTGFTNNQRVLRDALEGIQVQDVPSDLEDAMRIAQALFRTEPFKTAKILSDGNLPATTNFQLPFEPDYDVLPPGGANMGITAASAKRAGPGKWDLFVSVEGTAQTHASGTVELYKDGVLAGKEDVAVTPGKAEQLVFSVAAEQATGVELRLKPDGFDSLASDNSAFLDLEPARKLWVYAPKDLVWVRGALSAIDEVRLFPSGADTGESEPSFDLAILDHFDEPIAAKTDFCAYIGPLPQDLAPLVSVGQEGSDIVTWERMAPLLRHVQLNDVLIMDSPRYAPSASVRDLENLGYEVLADASAGPLILQKRLGPRLSYYLLFRRSTLPYRIGFPILVANLVQEAMSRKGLLESPGHQTGVLPPLTLKPNTSYSIHGPNDQARQQTSDAQGVLSGVWAPRVGRYEVREGSNIAANVGVSLLSSSETTLSQAKELKFAEIAVSASAKPLEVDRSFWPKLATLALVLLGIEWWLYQRKPGPFLGG